MRGARCIASPRLPLEQTVSNIAFAGLRLSRPWYERALRLSLHSPRRTILCDDCRSGICSLSRLGISSPAWENGGFLSFENADKTPCIVRRASLMVAHERFSDRFLHAHSFTESIVMCSIGVSPQSASRWFLIRPSATEKVESRSILGATFSR